MNIEFDAYKQKLGEIRPALDDLAASLNIEGLKFVTPATTAVCAVRVTRASRGAAAQGK